MISAPMLLKSTKREFEVFRRRIAEKLFEKSDDQSESALKSRAAVASARVKEPVMTIKTAPSVYPPPACLISWKVTRQGHLISYKIDLYS